jgi:hypothetical protein
MGGLLLLALFVLLGIESVKAWKVRSQYCTICGRKMGLWHVEDCHKKGRYSPGISIVIILSVVVPVAAVIVFLMR